MNQSYCVYHHVKDGEVFYVGCGKPTRPFCRFGRNDIWQSIAADSQFDVAIVRWFDDLKEALGFEREEIERLNPKANVRYGSAITESMKRFQKSAREHKLKMWEIEQRWRERCEVLRYRKSRRRMFEKVEK